MMAAIVIGLCHLAVAAEAAPGDTRETPRAELPSTPAGVVPDTQATDRLDLKAEWRAEHHELSWLMGRIDPPGRKGWPRPDFRRLENQAFRPESLVLPGDRDPTDIVLRRTEALLADLRGMSKAPPLEQPARRLAELRVDVEKTPVADEATRYGLFERVCALRRQIAFANPLLDFDRLLLVTRHSTRPYFPHMCDQFYGCHAVGGGGLLVVTNPFGPKPSVRNLLQGRTVIAGGLQGKDLDGGAFLSPDLSYDARRIAFAYSDASGRELNNNAWTPKGSWHIFTVNSDGSDLRQLTGGPWNDFDPCWIPDGRIVFISERRMATTLRKIAPTSK
jgi:hypothetical protein